MEAARRNETHTWSEGERRRGLIGWRDERAEADVEEGRVV